jgi:hypothetical protein
LIIAYGYRLIYRIVDDEVHIIVFINSARDLDRILKGENRT